MSNSKSPWAHILSADEVSAFHELTASIDPRFARDDKSFWKSRTANDLRALASQAWNCNDPTGYQLARSYAAMLQVTA